jgi:hypothetical protein
VSFVAYHDDQLTAPLLERAQIRIGWINRGVIQARRLNTGAPYWITLNEKDEQKLRDWVRNSRRIQNGTASLNATGGSAL